MAVNVNEIDDFDEELDATGSYSDSQINDSDDYYGENDGQYDDGSYYGESDDDFESEQQEDDIVYNLLRQKGIDPEAVKITNVYGQTESVRFDDLSADEKMQILNYSDVDDNYGLADSEVDLINQLRYHNINAQDYTNYVARQAIASYINNQAQQQQQMFEVDYVSDDELFLLDLKSRIPDISDDEAWEELESAKGNEDLYNKKISNLRDDYKQKEYLLQQEQYQEMAMQQEAQARQYESVIVNAIQNQDVMDLGDSQLSLSVDDKNELASFILDTDATGVRHIHKALSDPSTIVKMAWYALKGEEAFGQISDYYRQEISKAARYNYAKGYEDAKRGHVADSSKVVVKRPSSKKGNKPLTINDID